jgi:hypothetical protein
MPDRPKTTPPVPNPPRFNEDEALRQTFAHLIRPEDQETLDRLTDSMLELTREADAIVRHIDFSFPHNIAAAARDLRYLERWLRVTGAADGDCLDRWQARLADAAERAAPKVGEVAAELEAAVAANAEGR